MFLKSLIAVDKANYESAMLFLDRSRADDLYPMLAAAYRGRILMMMRRPDKALSHILKALEHKDESVLERDELFGWVYLSYLKAVLENDEDEVNRRKSQAKTIDSSKLAKDCLQF